MNQPRIQIAVTDPALRTKVATVLRAAGYDVHFDAEAQDSDFALLESSALAQQQQTWAEAIRHSRSVATAVGVLMERHRLSARHAFDALRRQARSERTQLVELARAIIAGTARLKPDPSET